MVEKVEGDASLHSHVDDPAGLKAGWSGGLSRSLATAMPNSAARLMVLEIAAVVKVLLQW